MTIAKKGNDFLLQVATTPAGVDYVTVGALRATGLTLNKTSVDITNKDGNGWSAMMPGGGVKSVTVSGSGIFTDVDSQRKLFEAFVGLNRASGTITLTDNPADGETVVINGVTWTFANIAAANTTVRGATAADTATQLAADINASVNASIRVLYARATGSVVTLTSVKPGAVGNAYTLAAGTADVTVSGATLTGGSTTTSHWNFRLQHFTGKYWTGAFNVDSFSLNGEHNVEQTYEIALSSSGAVVYA